MPNSFHLNGHLNHVQNVLTIISERSLVNVPLSKPESGINLKIKFRENLCVRLIKDFPRPYNKIQCMTSAFRSKVHHFENGATRSRSEIQCLYGNKSECVVKWFPSDLISKTSMNGKLEILGMTFFLQNLRSVPGLQSVQSRFNFWYICLSLYKPVKVYRKF